MRIWTEAQPQALRKPTIKIITQGMGVELDGEGLPSLCKALGLSLSGESARKPSVCWKHVVLGTAEKFLTVVSESPWKLCAVWITASISRLRRLGLSGPSLPVYRRLTSEDTGTLHFWPLGACSKDGDNIHTRKVRMIVFATSALLHLSIFHLISQQHRAIV